MSTLETTFLGLKLRNPVILASSGLGSTKEGVRKAFDAGAGAVILKSLFEEQLRAELSGIDGDAHPEAEAFLSGMGMVAGTEEYLQLIRDARAGAPGPVIASINCTGKSVWTDFARQIQDAGADAIELNLGFVPGEPSTGAAAIEDGLVGLVSSVTSAVSIPVAAKIGASYTNIGNLAWRLGRAGARGVTLFNRFYRLDVQLDTMTLTSGPMRSSPDAYHESLRWIAMLDGKVGADLCASGGVYDGATALKLVAAGAHAVQVCSAAYAKGYSVLGQIVREMESWMSAHAVASLADLRGRLSQRNAEKPELYGRLHYVKALTGQG